MEMGGAGGDFVRQFQVDQPALEIVPLTLESIPPVGTGIERSESRVAAIGNATDTDQYSFALAAGHAVTVLIATSTSVTPNVTVEDPLGDPQGTVTNLGDGQMLWQLPVTEIAGEYTLTMAFEDSATGAYSLELLVDSQFEMEMLGGATNDTPVTAQPLQTVKETPPGFLLASVNGRTSTDPFVRDQAFGYDAIAVPFEFEDISGTGTGVLADEDDAFLELTASDLGDFTFPFYGTQRDRLLLNDNGLITFGDAFNGSYVNDDLTGTPDAPLIAPYWDDLRPASAPRQVYWEILGTGNQRRPVVQWNMISFYGEPAAQNISFQAVLFENGEIQFNYLDLDANNSYDEGGSATVGIRDVAANGGGRLLVSYLDSANYFVGTGKSVRIGVGIAPPAKDIYSIELTDSVPTTFTLGSQAGLRMELYDANETLLATSSRIVDVQQIRDFLPTTTGVYYVHVIGATDIDYAINAVQGASLARR